MLDVNPFPTLIGMEPSASAWSVSVRIWTGTLLGGFETKQFFPRRIRERFRPAERLAQSQPKMSRFVLGQILYHPREVHVRLTWKNAVDVVPGAIGINRVSGRIALIHRVGLSSERLVRWLKDICPL
ncbi:hypothetical protein [Agromyces aureus]|uniref:hypothetical protein n=1 Tax=Agromyces aureus TaxID=453304 RepID=UPI000A89CB76|nr:hypothetical protein [Agromyces aureus]